MTYTEVNGFQIPDLTLPEEADEITEMAGGRYARKRREYLKNHRQGLFTDLLTTCTLNQHLAEIEQTARNRMELMVAQMAAAQGVTEELKQHNQMRWVGLMNNIRYSVEETIFSDLIYS
ncbi:MAG: TnpV protein [Oscillospiraceae bacterium]|nr:TnpV protein [Oscillospiraceae bacterium]